MRHSTRQTRTGSERRGDGLQAAIPHSQRPFCGEVRANVLRGSSCSQVYQEQSTWMRTRYEFQRLNDLLREQVSSAGVEWRLARPGEPSKLKTADPSSRPAETF